jgi:hypothetical protein
MINDAILIVGTCIFITIYLIGIFLIIYKYLGTHHRSKYQDYYPTEWRFFETKTTHETKEK